MFAQLLREVATCETTSTNGITAGQHTVTYGELPIMVEAIGDYLLAQGIKSTDCIALECPNTMPTVLTIFSLMERGINFLLLPQMQEGQQDLKPVPQFCHYRVVVNATQPTATQSTSGRPSGERDWAQHPERFLVIEKNPYFQPPPGGMDHGEGRVYLRTSGSMGTSKIVVHSHDNFVGNALSCVKKYSLEPSDRVVVPIPLTHIYGLAGAFLPAFAAGASIDLQSNTNHLQYFAREKTFNPNVAFITPTICDLLLPSFSTPRTYKVVVTSAQRITDDLFRRFDEQIGGTLINMYGSSELGTVAGCDPHDPLETKITTIGQPLQTAKLRIQQPDPATGIGELQCQNEVSFVGYVDEAGTWLQRNAQNEWFDTGDLATVTDVGNIRLVGRAKNSTNRSGYLVMFSDIERIMEGFEEIAQAVVVASAEENERGQALVAFCIPRPGVALNSQQLRRSCFDKMPTYAVPDEVRIMATLPLLPSGKVDQQALKKQAQTLSNGVQHERASQEIRSSEDVVEALTHLIANELDITIKPADIQPHMALFNDGLRLDSIALVKLTTKLKEKFKLEFADDALDMDVLQSVETLSTWIYGHMTLSANAHKNQPLSTAQKAVHEAEEHLDQYNRNGQLLQNLRANASLLHIRAATFGITYYDLLDANQSAHDPPSWCAALVKHAQRYESAARAASAAEQHLSARGWWQMATNYYHFVQIFLDGAEREEYRAKCWQAYEQLATLVEPQAQRVIIPFQDMTLPGYLRIAHPGAPCVILLGGFEYGKETEMHHCGEYFLQRGMSVLCFDGPGQGENAGNSSMRGDFEIIIAAVIDFLDSQIDQVDASRIGIFGISLGGYMAMRCAAMEERVTACVSLSGPFDGRTTRNLAPLNQLTTAQLFGFDDVEQLIDPDGPINLAALPHGMKQPLYIVHGTLDHIVPTDQVELIQDWAEEEVELLVIEDGEHCCFSHEREIMPKSGDWMARQLGAVVEQRQMAMVQ